MLCKHAVTAESGSPVQQLKNYVLALLTDRRDMFHLDDEFATTKVCSCLLTPIPQLGCPGRYELSFHNHRRCLALSTSEIFSIASPTRHRARRTPSLWSRKLLNFPERNAGTRNIDVEGVERAENVEATRRAGDQAYCFA